VAVTSQEAFALIFGAEGNSPVRDPGWPKGAAEIFNVQSRIAYWVGPLGGHWHADCRGDAKALSAVLADFAKLDVKNKRVVLHDGVGKSSWLNNNPARRAAAKMDWMFMFWESADWDRRRRFPGEPNPADGKDAESGPPAQIDVYTGGNVNWDDVKVPKGLKIVDLRLESHGFTLADGIVLEGKVTDLATKKPVTALVRLERIEPQPKGAHRYTTIAETVADAAGHWVFKGAPEGWLRVTIEADGFVPRVAGNDSFDDQPKWQVYDSGLSRPAAVTGRVIDDAGQPLADVEVRIGVVTPDGEGYASPADPSVKTDKDGRFRTENVPVGKATISAHKPGYVRKDLGQPVATPKNDVELKLMKAARVEVTVDFTGKERPGEYLVRFGPEGGDRVGAYGGVGQINAKNQMTFENVPAGRYVFSGRPNPSSDNQETNPITVDLKGGETAKVTLNAK
jgi:Carboxypeptidase regulatory-like domain